MRRSPLLGILYVTLVVSGFGVALGATRKAEPAQHVTVDPEALAALDKMGAYLRTLTSFEIKADTTTESVLDNDQKLQFAGKVDYKVRRPDGFQITVADDRKVRQFYYDGKTLTVYSPRLGFYAAVPAPPTIREVLKSAYEKFGIQLPLEDLFRWGLPDDRHDDITSGFLVGYAKVNGVDADQYAFRQGDVDWQIWIARGDKPLPLKAVLTTTADRTRPEFSAVLNWTPATPFAGNTFDFRPPAGAKPITFAQR